LQLNTPLEQFKINLLFPIKLGFIDMSFTNSSLYLLMACVVFFSFFYFVVLDLKVIPKIWQFIAESFYKFIYTLIKEQSGIKGQELFPFLFLLFIVILMSNLIGMTPYGFTVTSHIVATLTLSLTCIIALTIIAFQIQHLKFFSIFIPQNVPVALIGIITPIEIVSYISRVISLALRLFANMMAGHTLLYILTGFIFSLYKVSPIIALFPWLVILAIVCLEIGIAFLQTYVFVILFCIYMNDSLYGH
jgi:ATP synthase subunit 6